MKRGGPNHPKVFALAELLKCRRPTAVGYLEMLFHFTSQYAPEGDVGRYSIKRIAAALDWPGKSQILIDALVTSGWLDLHPALGLVVHDWNEHADRTTLQRLARQGKSPIQQIVTDTKILCTHNETKKNSKVIEDLHPTRARALPEPEPYQSHDFQTADWVEAVYLRHPKKRDKGLAERALVGYLASGGSREAFDAVHGAWCATEAWQEKSGQFAPKLAEWVQDEGWKSMPPSVRKPGIMRVTRDDIRVAEAKFAAEYAAWLAAGHEGTEHDYADWSIRQAAN